MTVTSRRQAGTGRDLNAPGSASARQRASPPVAAPPSHGWLTWRRLPVAAELVILGAAYGAPSLVRLLLPADRSAAFTHAAGLYHAEQVLHLAIEPYLNRLISASGAAAEAAGYYYGLLHFIVTPLVLAGLYLRRPSAFARLRSALVAATAAANIVFWTFPVAPPRFAVPGIADILVDGDILGSADPHGVTSAINLYAAMPSLHVCWAAWCAVAVVSATRSRWRYIAWLYPLATAFVVLATGNHFVFDVIGGLAVTALGTAAATLHHDSHIGEVKGEPDAETPAARKSGPPAPARPGQGGQPRQPGIRAPSHRTIAAARADAAGQRYGRYCPGRS